MLRRELGEPKSLLYVGVRHDMKSWWHDVLCTKLGIQWAGVVEIFAPNLARFEVECWSGGYPLVQRFHEGDITLRGFIEDVVTDYDVVFFDHGPEHVELTRLAEATHLLQQSVKKGLLYCGPWGSWPQGAEDGNPFEEHVTVLTPDLMSSIGMKSTVTFNGEGVENEGELVSWWSRRG